MANHPMDTRDTYPNKKKPPQGPITPMRSPK